MEECNGKKGGGESTVTRSNMQLLKLMLLAALALWRGGAARARGSRRPQQGVANRLRHEYKTMLDAQVAA